MTIVKTDNRMGETKDENVEKSVSNISGSILVSGVGAGTTVVNLVCFWCSANLLRTPTAVSTAIAWLFSVIFAYITNRTFVFRSQNRGLAAILREMTAFFGARIFSGALDVALMVISWMDCICPKCG